MTAIDWPAHVRRVIDRLGEDVTYTPSGGGAKTVRGILVGPFGVVSGAALGFETQRTEFVAMKADFPAPARNDSIERAAVVYKVREVEPDLVGGFARLVIG